MYIVIYKYTADEDVIGGRRSLVTVGLWMLLYMRCMNAQGQYCMSDSPSSNSHTTIAEQPSRGQLICFYDT